MVSFPYKKYLINFTFRGKFSMRNALGTNKVLTRPQDFFNILFDHRVVRKKKDDYDYINIFKEISAIIPISDEAIRVLYKHKRNFVSEHAASNIVLSLWTTSLFYNL
jgi:hypothetical protein